MMKDIWDKIPPSERYAIMQGVAKQRWASKSTAERKAHSDMMNQAKKSKCIDKNNND